MGRGPSAQAAARALALLAVVAKADDMRIRAVGAGDSLVLEDACNTPAVLRAPLTLSLGGPSAAAPHSQDQGSLTTVTLTVDAACGRARAQMVPY